MDSKTLICGLCLFSALALFHSTALAKAPPPQRMTLAPGARAAAPKMSMVPHIPKKWTRLSLTLTEGSCWGEFKKQRTILAHPTGVFILTPKKKTRPWRSRAWWTKTVRLFNIGIAGARLYKQGQKVSCDAGNYYCRFVVRVWQGKQLRTIRGCCANTQKARSFTKAWKRFPITK